MVTTHEALAAEVFRMSGSSDWIGITSVCISATLMPLKHRKMTVSSAEERSCSTRGSASFAVFTVSVTRPPAIGDPVCRAVCILHMYLAHSG